MPRWMRTLFAVLLLARLLPGWALAIGDPAAAATAFAGDAAPLAEASGPALHDHDGDDWNDGWDDGDDHDDDREDGHEDGPGGDDGREDDGHETYDRQYSFYGQVRWSGERTIVGSRELVGDDPWLPYLAPGMRLEVKGEVQGSRIRVSRIEIKYPTVWAYYLGPAQVIGLEGGWIRAWLSGSAGRDLFKLLPAAGETTPLLVACYERGSWRSVPLGLRPDARPPEDGWWRLTGSLSGSGVAWTLAGRLPGDCN